MGRVGIAVIVMVTLTACRHGYDPLASDAGAGAPDADPDAPDAASCADLPCPEPLWCSPDTNTCVMPERFSVGGSATGVTGTLELVNNGSDRLTLTTSGAFAFADRLAAGDSYAVVVDVAPGDSSCFVLNGSGVISDADITDIEVACTAVTTEGIRCGGDVCDDDLQKCCHDEVGAGGTCADLAGNCGSNQSAMECDDPSDCAGDICCSYVDPGGQLKEATCSASCGPQGSLTPILLCVPVSPSQCGTGSCELSAERNLYYCQ